MNTTKWKIIQLDPEEYILLSDSSTIKKIKGQQASDLIAVLRSIQEQKTMDALVLDQCSTFLQQDKKEELFSWLVENKLLAPHTTKQETYFIDIIGEFGHDLQQISAFCKGLPESIRVSTVYNLSDPLCPEFKKTKEDVALTLLIGPYFYNASNVAKISAFQATQSSDFLFVEFYENGILLGPLMNSAKDTVCLTCVETRKLFNTCNPQLIMEHIWEKDRMQEYVVSVFDIGSFSLYASFVYNELNKILFRNTKTLYNKATFIDFNRYNNQFFQVLKSPSCSICSNVTIYNPL